MNFIYEDISKEDYEKFGIGELKERLKRFNGKSFRKWSINEAKDVYLILVKSTTNMDEPDFGTSFYVMSVKDIWVEFERQTIDSGGTYAGETWSKYAITKISPFLWDEAGHKLYIEKNDLSVEYDTILSMFCAAVTAESKWGHHRSIKHDVFFENLTQKAKV